MLLGNIEAYRGSLFKLQRNVYISSRLLSIRPLVFPVHSLDRTSLQWSTIISSGDPSTTTNAHRGSHWITLVSLVLTLHHT